MDDYLISHVIDKMSISIFINELHLSQGLNSNMS